MAGVVSRPIGGWSVSATADNATATATVAASTNLRHHITGVAGGFSATVSGKTLILKAGSTEVARWYVYDTLAVTFSTPIEMPQNTAANLELAASGGGGTIGGATLMGFTL